MTNLITIENTNAVVELSTILEFSGLSDQAVKKIVKKQMKRLIKNGLSYSYDLAEDLNYSEMKFDEKSCTLLLTLLPNNEVTEQFKEDLVNGFFKMRDEIFQIREQALLETFKEEKRLAIREANKMNDYNGYITVGKYVSEIDGTHDKDFVWNAVEFSKYSYHKPVTTKYRFISPECSPMIGKSIKGTKGTPAFTEVAIREAVRVYEDYLEHQEEEE